MESDLEVLLTGSDLPKSDCVYPRAMRLSPRGEWKLLHDAVEGRTGQHTSNDIVGLGLTWGWAKGRPSLEQDPPKSLILVREL